MVILVPERYPSHEGSSTRWVVLIMFLSTVQLFLSQSLPKAPSPSRAHPPKCPPHTLLFQALQETSLLVAFDARVCLSGKRARLNTQNPDFCPQCVASCIFRFMPMTEPLGHLLFGVHNTLPTTSQGTANLTRWTAMDSRSQADCAMTFGALIYPFDQIRVQPWRSSWAHSRYQCVEVGMRLTTFYPESDGIGGVQGPRRVTRGRRLNNSGDNPGRAQLSEGNQRRRDRQRCILRHEPRLPLFHLPHVLPQYETRRSNTVSLVRPCRIRAYCLTHGHR